MKFSAFTRFGHLRFTGGESRAKQAFLALMANYGPAYDYAPGTHMGAKVFAKAMCVAGAAAAIERAENQRHGATATDKIPSLERDYGVVPGESDTLNQRRNAIAAKEILPGGASQRNVEYALSTLLGEDFVAYVPANRADLATPATLDAGPGTFPRDIAPLKVFTLTSPIAITGSPITFTYSGVEQLVARQVAVVQIENLILAEHVTIASVSGYTATATFTKSHDAGASIRVGPTPYWESPQRYSLVVVSPAAARDPERRRKVHAMMRALCRETSTWSVVEATSASTAGPFTLGSSFLGGAPLETVTF